MWALRRARSEIIFGLGCKNNMNNLKDAYIRFCDILTMAEKYFEKGDLSAAVGLAQIAVRHVFPGKGLFASPRLENLLLEIGKQIPVCRSRNFKERDKKSRNVLHILTHARPIGGDSRFVWRWIERDYKNRHSVVITTHGNGIFEIPKVLIEVVHKSGGFLRALSESASKPLERACELRALCQGMDVVVLHLFPYDIVPLLALAVGCEASKVVFVNHADHTFWVGSSVADLILHLREQSAQFLKKRRGLEPNQSSILPIPIVYSPIGKNRDQAKRELGYEPGVVILLTIATPFKYSAPNQIGFLDLVTPVIVQSQKAVLIAVGPYPKGVWRSANIRTNGRIVPLGTRWDNDLLYAAADVYLDSIPFSSITSLLEAGSHGLPLIGYRLPNSELTLLGPSAPGLNNSIKMATDKESYRILLTRLIEDAEFRLKQGKIAQKNILSLHDGDKWLQSLNDMYERIYSSTGRKCLTDKKDAFKNCALNQMLVGLYSKGPFSYRRLIRDSIGGLSYRSRLTITWRLHRLGFDLCLLNLVPPPVDVSVHRVGRWVKRKMRLHFKLQ